MLRGDKLCVKLVEEKSAIIANEHNKSLIVLKFTTYCELCDELTHSSEACPLSEKNIKNTVLNLVEHKGVFTIDTLARKLKLQDHNRLKKIVCSLVNNGTLFAGTSESCYRENQKRRRVGSQDEYADEDTFNSNVYFWRNELKIAERTRGSSTCDDSDHDNDFDNADEANEEDNKEEDGSDDASQDDSDAEDCDDNKDEDCCDNIIDFVHEAEIEPVKPVKRAPNQYILDLTVLKVFIKSKLPHEPLNNVGAMTKACVKLLNTNGRNLEKAKKAFDPKSFLNDYTKASEEVDAKKVIKNSQDDHKPSKAVSLKLPSKLQKGSIILDFKTDITPVNSEEARCMLRFVMALDVVRQRDYDGGTNKEFIADMVKTIIKSPYTNYLNRDTGWNAGTDTEFNMLLDAFGDSVLKYLQHKSDVGKQLNTCASELRNIVHTIFVHIRKNDRSQSNIVMKFDSVSDALCASGKYDRFI
ncbi:hypothetical protein YASMINEVIRUS_545 [Yasminevirus sp. GU-2018]|uniref:Uncharacterized protein n=1 Tax=Yasminevirus sp. GU-2018 TaxID=2420051 RepID=A0A5K0U9G4_9VIRU|nr:hypothetical protein YASMINEVIRUS_545 [Yasminevirus sp. GU-2018]